MSASIISKIRSGGKTVERRIALIRWCLPRRKSGFQYTAHILAAKDTKYLAIAKIAVASFLYHNPKSQVVIHCDNATYRQALLEFKFFMKRGTVKIIPNNQDDNSWQLQKINLLCEIANKQSNFYMDCDVRWNGCLTLPEVCTSYVSEFQLREKSPFLELLPLLGLESHEIQMLNTTFVYLYPGNFTDSELGEIVNCHDEIIKLCNSGAVAELDVEQIKRLSEQIGYSIFLCKSGRKHVPLKSHDGHMDGSFLESSYFGATGAEF